METTLAQQPLILEWMSPEEKSFRAHFPEVITKLPAHSFLDPHTFAIEGYFTGDNVGSVVCKVRDKNGTYIVKFISEQRTLLIEAAFLKRWREVGARVVNLLELVEPKDGFDICAAILEYIPTGTTQEMLRQEREKTLPVYERLGRALAIMHRAKGERFGEVIDIAGFKGQHATYKEEIESMLTPEKQELLIAGKLLANDDKRLISNAIALIENDVRAGTSPSLIHDDPGVHNTFGVETLTFFDPDPKISHPLIDVAIASVWAIIATGDQESLTALADGYQSEFPYDELVLQACVFLKLLEKWQWWLHRGKTESFALEWIEKMKPLFMNAKDQIRTHSILSRQNQTTCQ